MQVCRFEIGQFRPDFIGLSEEEREGACQRQGEEKEEPLGIDRRMPAQSGGRLHLLAE